MKAKENVLQALDLNPIRKRIRKRIYEAVISAQIDSLNDLILIIKNEMKKHFLKKNFIDIDEFELNKFITKLILSNFGLEKIAELISDNEIDEIYIDGANKPIYLDHRTRGRIITNIHLTKEEIDHLIFFLKFFSELFISRTKPSDKVELDLGYTKLRISVDRPPLVKDYSIVIRKQNKDAFHIINVLKANEPLAVFLLLILAIMRKNILILGEPGSGKTFLASSLLNMLPDYWRLIIIEDVKEINIEREYALVRYKVNPFESRINDEFSKEKQILKALHRSPDYIFVGEIQDKDDARAYFHGLSSGLKILATSHSTSLIEFIDRIKNSFNLDVKRICLIDSIVFMKKKIGLNKNIRVIDKICLSKKLFYGSIDGIINRKKIEVIHLTNDKNGDGYIFLCFDSKRLELYFFKEIVFNLLKRHIPEHDTNQLNNIIDEFNKIKHIIYKKGEINSNREKHVIEQIKSHLKAIDSLLN